MRFKLIVVFVEDSMTEQVDAAAKAAGATGCTRIYSASGEGIERKATFLGLTLETQRDVLLLLVEEHRSRAILESIGEAGEFDETSGTGIAFQIDVEDAIGVMHQAATIAADMKESGND
ncbi:MAG: P-II family nitrogen regulator [Gammaproteobacteria bacterium]|nr:P-II family nitrogen regulator [Gammaproteobacteria bacterium]